MRLFPFALLVNIWSIPAFAQDSCDFLHKRTQAFSDAGQRGDGAALAKMLDPDVIFFNETGEKATRADLAGATPPAAGAPIRNITTTDWGCKVYGDVAVTSFIDVLEQGKPGEMKFTFARKGSELVASLNGGAESAQKAQSRDVFFTPGHGTTPKVFQRGDDGKITGFIYLRGKNSIVFKRVV